MRGIVWLILLFTVAVVAATVLGSNDGSGHAVLARLGAPTCR